MENSEIDAIIEEQQFEALLKHKENPHYKAGMRSLRSQRINKISAGIKRNLRKAGPYPLDSVSAFIENYKLYPEVRHFAKKILPKIIEGETVTPRRLNAYNLLRRKMTEFQR